MINEFVNDLGDSNGSSCAYCGGYERHGGHDDACELSLFLKFYSDLLHENSKIANDGERLFHKNQELEKEIERLKKEHAQELAAEDEESIKACNVSYRLGYDRGMETGQGLASLNRAIEYLQLEIKILTEERDAALAEVERLRNESK